MFKRIMVPLDNSENSEAILPYVSRIAAAIQLSVVLCTIGREEVLAESAQSSQKTQLERISYELAEKKILTQAIRIEGQPAEQIVETSQRLGCNLIAMSTHGRNALSKSVLGSVTNEVMHSAHVPILAIRPVRVGDDKIEEERICNIIVPLDGSQIAETVLPYAGYLAEKLSVPIALVRVVSTGGNYSGDIDGLHDSDLKSEVRAEEYLARMAGALESKQLDVSWKLLRGSPSSVLVDLAHRTPGNLVALCTHGHSGIKRLVLGSVAESLIRDSGGPVLVVPPAQLAKGEERAQNWFYFFKHPPIFSV